MRLRDLLAALVVVALLASTGKGQTGWTLAQCIARAKELSPTLLAARNLAHASALAQRELSTTGLPQVKLSALALYAPTSGSFGYDPAISNGGEYAGQAVVQQSMYDGGVRGLKSEQLQIELEQKSEDIRRSERDLLLAVNLGFLDVLKARSEAELQHESVGQMEEYLALVHRLASAGNASETDVLKTELQLENARCAYRQATGEEETATITLREAIGLPADTAFSVQGSIDDMTVCEADSLGTVPTQLPPSTLDLKQSEREISHSLLDIALVQHESNPIVNLFADAGMVTSGDNLRLPANQRDPMWGFSLGVSLEIPLLTWGANGLRIQQKELAAENIRIEHEALRRSLAASLQRLRVQLANARERLHTATSSVVKAEQNFLLTKSKFAAGATTSLEVLAAQQLLTDSRLAILQATVDIQNIRARITQILAQ